MAYRRAIENYYRVDGSFPQKLEDLASDPRLPSRRHLRSLYPDPFATDEQKDWLVFRAADGGIRAVASSSREKPIKQANFPAGLEKLAGAASYRDWVFEFIPELKHQ